MGKKMLVGLLVLCMIAALPLTALAAPAQNDPDKDGYDYIEFVIGDDGSVAVTDQGTGGATTFDGAYSGTITPMAIGGGSCSISKSGSTITVSGKTTSGTSKALKISVQIQKLSGGSWTNVSGGSASKSATGYSVSTSKSKAVSAGTYRCRGTHTIGGAVTYSYSSSKVV